MSLGNPVSGRNFAAEFKLPGLPNAARDTSTSVKKKITFARMSRKLIVTNESSSVTLNIGFKEYDIESGKYLSVSPGETKEFNVIVQEFYVQSASSAAFNYLAELTTIHASQEENYPSVLPLTGWWRDFKTGIWSGAASTGLSSARPLTLISGTPTQSLLNGRGVANLTQAGTGSTGYITGDFFSANMPLSNFVKPSTFSLWCLAKISVQSPINTIHFLSDIEQYFIMARYGAIIPIRMQINVWGAGAADYTSAAINNDLADWTLLQARASGSTLSIRANAGTWVTNNTSAPIDVLSSSLIVGGTSDTTTPAAYSIADVGISDQYFSDASFDKILAYAKNRYNLTF